MAEDKLRRLLYDRLEAKRATRSAVVSSAPTDANGRRQPYVNATINGQTVRVYCESEEHGYRTGDTLLVEETGTPGAAYYRAVTWTAGTRPLSTITEISDATTINDVTFGPGDQIIGNPYGAHWWYDYSAGTFRIRDGAETIGVLGPLDNEYGIDATGLVGAIFGKDGPEEINVRISNLGGFEIYRGETRIGTWGTDGNIVLGNEEGGHIVIDPNAELLEFRHDDESLMGFDAESMSMYGWQRWGLPHGPALEAGIVKDEDADGNPVMDSHGEQQTRYVFRGIAKSGVPFFSFMTGTVDNPDEIKVVIGKPGSPAMTIDGDTITYDVTALRDTLDTESITNAMLQSGSVTTGILGDGSVTAIKFDANALDIIIADEDGNVLTDEDGNVLREEN